MTGTFSQEEIDVLAMTYPHVPTAWIAEAMGRPIRSIYYMARKLGLAKTEAFLESELAGRIQKGSGIGANGRFQKGITPWNKGKHFAAGGRSKDTRFKPGFRRGRAHDLYQPIGTERVSKDGYLERKINDDMPLQKRWRAVHLIIWEAENGPLPAGHAVVFKDGNKRNFSLGNLEAISRAELMRRNTIRNHPPEIVAVMRLRSAIKRQISKREGNHHGQQ